MKPTVFWGEKGKLTDPEQFEAHIKTLEKEFSVTIEPIKKTRTSQQNRALWLWCTLLATELNNSGNDMRKVIREGIDIPWTKDTVMEYLIKPVMKVLLGKKSTRALETHEIDKVFDVVNRHIGERTGVFVEFPTAEELMF